MSEFEKSLLAVEELSYQYGRMLVWENVNFSLGAGQLAFLVGPNGTGKSTLLRCLAGLSAPKSGEIYVMGKRFFGSSRELRSRLAFVPDMPAFYDDLTAEEHIHFVLRANRKDDEFPHAEDLLRKFGLERYRKQLPSSYSRGMREKLALVIALTVKPQVLLLDEPYGPLDFESSVLLSEQIKDLIESGSSVILSCHQHVPGLRPDRVFRFNEELLSVEDASVLDRLWPQQVDGSQEDSALSDEPKDSHDA